MIGMSDPVMPHARPMPFIAQEADKGGSRQGKGALMTQDQSLGNQRERHGNRVKPNAAKKNAAMGKGT